MIYDNRFFCISLGILFSNMSLLIAQDCIPGTSKAVLHINKIRANLYHSGSMFWNGKESPVYNVIPDSASSEVTAIFAGGIWLGGIQKGKIKTAVSQFGVSNGTVDWYPGPIQFFTGETDPKTCENWDRHFEVLGSDIETFLNIYHSLGDQISVDDIPSSLLAWPAKQNPHFKSQTGFDLPIDDGGLAPFWDNNQDFRYNPLDGDYPVLGLDHCNDKVFADQMIFWIYNDSGGAHLQSKSENMKVEIHQMSFAFDSTEALDYTTFHKFDIINRSESPIQSTHFGFWTDPDLGCAADDFMGTEVDHQLIYIYNRDEFDGDENCACAQATFCTDIPLLGYSVIDAPVNAPETFEITVPIDWEPDSLTIVFSSTLLRGDTTKLITGIRSLRTAMTGSSFQVSTQNGVPTLQGLPSANPINYYRYLTGFWNDGSAIFKGGTGYNPMGSEKTSYVFTDRPNDPMGWSMCNQDLPDLDIRVLQSSGPFDLDIGERKSITQSIYFVPNIDDYPCPDIAPLLKVDEQVKDIFNRCFGVDVISSVPEIKKENTALTIYPNPTDDYFYIDPLTTIKEVLVFNTTGQMVRRYDLAGSRYDIRGISEGIYLIKIVLSNGQGYTKKLQIIR